MSKEIEVSKYAADHGEDIKTYENFEIPDTMTFKELQTLLKETKGRYTIDQVQGSLYLIKYVDYEILEHTGKFYLTELDNKSIKLDVKGEKWVWVQ